LLEFAIVLPLLVVFIVGIYDFSGAFNEKQKISHAAQEGAIVAGAQPMADMDPPNPPDSLQPVLEAIYNSLAANNVLPPNSNLGGCTVVPTYVSGLKWSYAVSGCTPDTLAIDIDRGLPIDPASPSPASVRTEVRVSYPYHWRFNGVIQLAVPGATYAAVTNLSETATVHNQM
jgi:hypothetical protein